MPENTCNQFDYNSLWQPLSLYELKKPVSLNDFQPKDSYINPYFNEIKFKQPKLNKSNKPKLDRQAS